MKNTLLKLLALLTLVCMLLPMAMAEEVFSEPVEAIIAEEEAALTGEEEGVVEVEAANDAMLDYDDEDDEDWDEDDEDCEHEYTYTEIVFDNATYTPKDAYTHTVTGEKVEETICENCLTTIARKSLGMVTEDLGHEFALNDDDEYLDEYDEDDEDETPRVKQEKGTCVYCGYKCQHPSTDRQIIDRFDADDETVTYKSKNNKVHSVTGIKYHYVFCNVCMMELEKKSLGKVTETENHAYSDGKCFLCKHKNTCKHKNKKTVYDYLEVGPYLFDESNTYDATDLDDTYHIALNVYEYKYSICKDCGSTLKSTKSEPKTNLKLKHNYKNGKCKNCGHIQPPPAPTSVSIAKSATVKLGETLTLTPTLKPTNATTTYTWKSAKPAIAKVDANGIVTPVKEGSVKITVTTANKKKATITVKVVDPNKPTKVALSNGKKATLKVGETLQLNAVLTPDSAKTTFKWSSDKKAVASVDGNGLVTAKKAGKAKITVTTANKKKATITITVTK